MPRIEIPEGKGDPEVRMWKLRPEMGMGAGALSHAVYEQSIVPVRERELARMRIAQINDCAICQQWRKTAGAAEALTEDDYANVARVAHVSPATPSGSGWRSSTPSGSRSTTTRIDDDFFARLRAAYTDAEILDLTVCIGAWLALGRTMNVLGIDELLPHSAVGIPARAQAVRLAFAAMGDLAIDTAVERQRRPLRRRAVARTGRSGDRTAATSRAIALRAAGAHSRFDRPVTLVGHFLGVADFDDRSTSRSRRCARPSARSRSACR